VTVFCQSTNPLPHAFAQFCQHLAALCLTKLDAGSLSSKLSGSAECPGSSGEAARMYAISLRRLVSAATSTTLPGDEDLSGLILARAARCLLQIELNLYSAADVKQLASAYGCLQDDLDIGTLQEALLFATHGPRAVCTSTPQAYSMPTQTNTHIKHVPTHCETDEAWNEPFAAPASHFEDDIGCGSSPGDVDFESAATGFQVEDTQRLEPEQPYLVRSGAADRQILFNANPWFEQQVFNSGVLLDQAANQVPAANWEDFVQSVAENGQKEGHPQHPMLVKSEVLDRTSLLGTTISSDNFGSGDSSTVLSEELHDEFFEYDMRVLDNHNLSSINEHLVMGPAACAVKNTFIDVADPEWRSVRAAASRFHTEQPVPNFLHHHTGMQSTESWIQGFKHEIDLHQHDNTSPAKVEDQDNKNRQSSRKGETPFFKQVMSATSARDLLDKETPSRKAASSALLPNTSHQRLAQETSNQLPHGKSLANGLMTEMCGLALRGDVSIALQQMSPPGSCEECLSDTLQHVAWTETM